MELGKGHSFFLQTNLFRKFHKKKKKNFCVINDAKKHLMLQHKQILIVKYTMSVF